MPAQKFLTETTLQLIGLSSINRIVDVNIVAFAAGCHEFVIRTEGNSSEGAISLMGKNPFTDNLRNAVYFQ
jgi:hypothetical protein